MHGPLTQDMIKEASVAYGLEARLGLGRPTIKKYIQCDSAR